MNPTRRTSTGYGWSLDRCIIIGGAMPSPGAHERREGRRAVTTADGD